MGLSLAVMGVLDNAQQDLQVDTSLWEVPEICDHFHSSDADDASAIVAENEASADEVDQGTDDVDEQLVFASDAVGFGIGWDDGDDARVAVDFGVSSDGGGAVVANGAIVAVCKY